MDCELIPADPALFSSQQLTATTDDDLGIDAIVGGGRTAGGQISSAAPHAGTATRPRVYPKPFLVGLARNYEAWSAEGGVWTVPGAAQTALYKRILAREFGGPAPRWTEADPRGTRRLAWTGASRRRRADRLLRLLAPAGKGPLFTGLA